MGMAFSRTWGSFKRSLGAPLKRFGVDVRQLVFMCVCPCDKSHIIWSLCNSP